MSIVNSRGIPNPDDTGAVSEVFVPVTIITLVIVIGVAASSFCVPQADGGCCSTTFWMAEARSNRHQAVA